MTPLELEAPCGLDEVLRRQVDADEPASPAGETQMVGARAEPDLQDAPAIQIEAVDGLRRPRLRAVAVPFDVFEVLLAMSGCFADVRPTGHGGPVAACLFLVLARGTVGGAGQAADLEERFEEAGDAASASARGGRWHCQPSLHRGHCDLCRVRARVSGSRRWGHSSRARRAEWSHRLHWPTRRRRAAAPGPRGQGPRPAAFGSTRPARRAGPGRGDLADAHALANLLREADAFVHVASLGFGHADAVVGALESAGVRRAIFFSSTSLFTRLPAASKGVRLAAEDAFEGWRETGRSSARR